MDIDEYRAFLKTLSDDEVAEEVVYDQAVSGACEMCRAALQESMDRRN